MEEKNFLQVLVAPQYWETLEIYEVLTLNGMDYCEKTFSNFRELVSVPQQIQNLSYNFSLVLTQ